MFWSETKYYWIIDSTDLSLVTSLGNFYITATSPSHRIHDKCLISEFLSLKVNSPLKSCLLSLISERKFLSEKVYVLCIHPVKTYHFNNHSTIFTDLNMLGSLCLHSNIHFHGWRFIFSFLVFFKLISWDLRFLKNYCF